MAYVKLILLFYISMVNCGSLEEEKYGVKFATPCEVCKLVTKEISELLNSHSSADVIETGYHIDSKEKKKIKYNFSELRLIEVLEEVCDGMKDYRIHKERKDSTRWAKSMSQTFKTLHGLVNKGVKVDLGIPQDLWDEPSAEVGELRIQCEQFLEENDEQINKWYFKGQSSSLQEYVCSKVVEDSACLSEPYGETIDSEDYDEKAKGDKGSKSRRITGNEL